jgi:hypothetical protein
MCRVETARGRLPEACDVSADLYYPRDTLGPDRCGEFRLHAIKTAHQHKVRGVDRRELHIDDDFAATGSAGSGRVTVSTTSHGLPNALI